MEQGVPGPRPRGRVRVKEEPPAGCARPAPEGRGRSPEHCRLRFRGFRYPEARGPREALRRLRQLCRLWLRPETHSKEQIVELLVLEQFLAVLPAELRARVRGRCPESGEEALAALEDAETDADTRDAAQQASVKTEEAAAQALVPEQWPHLRLAQRNLCGDSASEKVTSLSQMSKEASWSVLTFSHH
ncbi:piggyBac transposable element-derived protein 1 isoform X3 [Pteropus medius]|uniref:piggyBac transposable element-derived protein 1 isoform X3 n=1 Tax=Pteropus vampyrus TaxID=132908 RepID=UPI00196B3236|nr:piggyBac transposable element-derived protein 1 isoform X3 [Pteropus giganteus]